MGSGAQGSNGDHGQEHGHLAHAKDLQELWSSLQALGYSVSYLRPEPLPTGAYHWREEHPAAVLLCRELVCTGLTSHQVRTLAQLVLAIAIEERRKLQRGEDK